jgi:parallel beta-helix repeat protein
VLSEVKRIKMKKTYKIDVKASENIYSLVKKGLLPGLVVICLFAAFSMTASANPGAIKVPEDYPTIQQAIYNVTPANRTIEVNATAYNETETVVVNQSNIIIRSINGRAVVSAGGANDHVFNISDRTNVTMKGFEIRDAHDTGTFVAGIYMENASECNISNNNVTNVSGDNSYGIYLSHSNNNTFADVTINSTGTGAEFYEFWSDEYCTDNVVTDLTIENPTTISFTYGNGIWIKRVDAADRPEDPSENIGNIGKYINASNLTANSWLFVNFSYIESDVANVDENTLSVWKHNGTAWNENGWNESRFLDTANNVVGVNITSFSLFAPLGSKVAEPGESINVTIKPETLNLASEGKFTAFIQFSEGFDFSQINLSTVSCEGAPAVKGIAAGNVYIAKFNRQALANVPTGNVTLTVTGEFKDGTLFEGSDVIRVTDQGKQVVTETGIVAKIKNALKQGPPKNDGQSEKGNQGKSKGKKK